MSSKIEFIREGFREFCGRVDRHEEAPQTINADGLVENPFGFSTVVETGALIGFGQLDDMDLDVINCDKAVALVMRWDQPKKRPDRPDPVPYDRYEVLPFCLTCDGVLQIGGTKNADETRHGGWHKIVDPNDPRRYKIVTADQLSSPSAGHAVGQSRRGDIEGKDHSLNRKGNDPSDRLLLDAYCWLISAARKHKASKRLNEGKAIDSRMQFEVEALPNQPLALRWDDARWGDHRESMRIVDEAVSRNIKNGTWLNPSALPCEGVVSHVSPAMVTVQHDDRDEVVVYEVPLHVRDLITRLTGIPCADLPIVPLVEEGQRVGPRTSLFGPIEPHAMESDVETLQMLARSVSAGPMNMVMRMRQWRAWATLSEGRKLEGTAKTLYPISLVVPDDLRRTYLRLGASKIQHLTLLEGVPGSLRADPRYGIGYRVDLFDHSQRSKMLSDMTKPRQLKAPPPNQGGKRPQKPRPSTRHGKPPQRKPQPESTIVMDTDGALRKRHRKPE